MGIDSPNNQTTEDEMTSDCIEVSCPSCAFTRSVPSRNLPLKPVKAKCPKCGNSFTFDRHVQVPDPSVEVPEPATPQVENNESVAAKESPVGSAVTGGVVKKKLPIAECVPIIVGIVIYLLGAPWYVAVIFLLTASYWYGPILVYLKQRMPTQQLIRDLPADTPLPPEHNRFFEKTIPELDAAGFSPTGRFTNADDDEPVVGAITLMQNQTTSDIAHLLVSVTNCLTGEMIGFSRYRSDGSKICTGWSNIPSPFPPEPQDNTLIISEHINPSDLWSVHQARVAADPSAILNEPISDALAYQINMEQKGVQTKIASGMWQQAKQPGFIRPTAMGAFKMCLRMLFPWKQLNRKRSSIEVRRYLKKNPSEIKELPNMVMEHELSKSSNQNNNITQKLIPELKNISSSESKFSSLTLLIVTIILFFSSQIVTAKWQEILILIGVLLFHELGHLVAMKLLKYNDVKMFFIPFLGAAVSGNNLNDTAVKSCIVSLMGPFPGIVLGVMLYYLFFLTKNYYIFKTAQVMLLLNAFNFLPIMPLDGGRYIDVLFVNSRYFRFLFAFIGAVVFLFLAASSKDFLIAVIGIFTVYVALSNFKLHGISNDLKSKGIQATTVKDLIEDESAMHVVTKKLQSSYPKLFSPQLSCRAIFNQLTVIVDTIKFVPAKLLSKTILLATYLAMVSTSIVVSFFFLTANYKEIPRTEKINGKEYVCVERHFFGKKNSECPINEALYYDGKGIGVDTDGSLSDVFYYRNGFRTGEWLRYDKSGNVWEKKIYDRGRLLSLSKLESGIWKTYSYDDMSFLTRCSEEIQRLSQPYKSIYKYF